MSRLNNLNLTVFIWLCIFTIKIQSQNLYKLYQTEKITFTPGYINNKTIVDSLINEAKLLNSSIDISKIAHDFSMNAYIANKREDAVYYGELALKYQKKIGNKSIDYSNSLFRTGFFNYSINNFITAMNHYNKVIELNLDEIKVAQAYCEIGASFFSLNDYYKSISYYNKGITQLEKFNSYNILKREYLNLSKVYNELGTKETINQRLIILKKAEELKKHVDFSIRDKIKLDIAFSNLFANKNNFDFDKIKYYSNRGLQTSTINNIRDYTCPNYINLANAYNKEEKDSAYFFAVKAIEYCTNNTNKSVAFLQQSRYYRYNNDYRSSLISIQKGVNLLIDTKNKLYNSNITLNELKKSANKDHLLFMLYEKIKLLNKHKDTKLALQHVLVSDSLVDYIQKETSNTTKLLWRTRASEIYTQGAELCYNLDQPETAFYLSEKGKALLLTDGILQNTEYTKLPDSISKKELELKKKIIEQNSREDTFDAELQYEQYIGSITKAFPEHFKKLDAQKTITLKEVQKNLDDDTLIVSYLWPNEDVTESSVYALFINNNTIELLNIGDIKSFQDILITYNTLISKPFKNTADKNAYLANAHKLFNTLLPNRKTLGKEQLIIIPDGQLNNIPFEALITNIETKDYLINSKTISYAYSLSFLKHNTDIARGASKNFIGFAPETFNTELQLNTLSNSVSELNSISKIFDGDVFSNETATKSSFAENINDYKIIHLATHANASSNPWVAFKDEKIDLNELYTYKNNADLTVLSACETSIGEIVGGEGVMSLARGFFYSGSNAVVSSLWNVNDKSTVSIMEDFYKNLKKGKSKSESLRNAKLNYINTHSLSDASPYYWSSFILLGNTDKIDLKSEFSLLHYFILGLILLIIIFLSYKFKKK